MAPDRSERPPGKVILRNPLRGLRYSTLGLMVLIVAGILYVLTERTRGGDSGPPLASLETGEGVAQRALNLDVTRTRRGLPSLKVSAKEALTYRDGSTTLHDVAVTVIGEDRKTTEITAPVAVSGAGSSGGWSFKNGVELKDDEGFRVEVPEIDYHETPQELSAAGDVTFSTGAIEGTARGLRYLVGRRIIEFPADVEIRTAQGTDPSRKILSESARFDPRSHEIEFRKFRTVSSDGDTLSGTSLLVDIEEIDGRKVLRSLHSTRGFRAYLPGPEPPGDGAGGPGRTLTGDALDLSLDPSGRIESAAARGGVRLTDGDPNQDPRTISCDHLEAALDQGVITSVTASGSAHLRVPARQDPQGHTITLGADRLVARFEPGGQVLRRVEAETDVIATHGDRTLKAPHVAWETASGLWTLRGEGDLQASVTSPSGSISADSVDLDRPNDVLDAHGQVRTAYLEEVPDGAAAATVKASPPGADGAKRMAGLLGSGDGPLHAMSDALHLSLSDRKAHYTGNVRIWRGGGSIEAATVDYSDADGLLEARDHVVARVPVEGGAEGTTPGTVTVTSSTLRYDRQGMDARFGGGVIATSEGMRVRADTMHAAGTRLQGGLTSMVAEGKVTLRQGTIVGEGDRMESDYRKDLFTLYGQGRLATIQDQSNQQLVKGAVLTYERATGRIQVESESGGRTWITLRPKSEEGEHSDPKPPR